MLTYVLPGNTFTVSIIVAYSEADDVTTTPRNDDAIVVMVTNNGTTTDGSAVGAVLTRVNPYKW